MAYDRVGDPMAKSVQSFRMDPVHRDLVGAVVRHIEAGGTADIEQALHGRPVGPFRNADAALTFLRGRLVAMLKPAEVWLFGSRARGDNASDADFDLLVVLPDGRDARAYSYAAVAEPIVACGLPFDVVPCAVGEFDAIGSDSDTLVGTVKREGRRLYAAPARRRRESAAG